MSDSLWPHGLQHTRLPCPSPTPETCSNLCPLSRWCHPTISSSVVTFFCPQSFPASGSSSMSWLFASGSQSIGALASTSVLPVNTQDWSPLGWTGWISLQSKGLSRIFYNTTVISSINPIVVTRWETEMVMISRESLKLLWTVSSFVDQPLGLTVYI